MRVFLNDFNYFLKRILVKPRQRYIDKVDCFLVWCSINSKGIKFQTYLFHFNETFEYLLN